MAKVVLTSSTPDLKKISLPKFIRQGCGLSLAHAKQKTDQLLEGQRVELDLNSDIDANDFSQHVKRLGVEHVEIKVPESEIMVNEN